MSRFSRLLSRPSSRLVRAILIPLTVIQVVATAYLLILAHSAAENLAYDRIEGLTQAFAMSEPPAPEVLRRTADWIEADRIWLISATGRILSSNRAAEANALVDEIWWQDLPQNQRRVRREKAWGGRSYVQVAYHDIERGVWAMVIADLDGPLLAGTARVAAVLILSLLIWLMIAASVILVIRRTMGRALDVSDLVARRALEGSAASTASLARLRAAAAGYGPAQLLLQLVERMQERATRANEAETRFSLAVELLPGVAYLASYEGALLYAGPLMRQHLGAEAQMGQSVTDILPDLPLERVHTAALKSRRRNVTFDNLPVYEATEDKPAMQASIRSVIFRGVQGYVAHLESVTDAGEKTRARVRTSDLERQVLDGIQELVIAFDGATQTLLWNQAAELFTGAQAAEVPDLRKAIERLFIGEAAVASFAEWMDGSPEKEPLIVQSQTVDGKDVTVSWLAAELSVDGRTIGGALFGTVLPHRSAGEAGPGDGAESEADAVPDADSEADRESDPVKDR
ncbi:MAG: PAS domain-containing protein, partial [Rhodothermales bacterium]